MSQTVPEHKIRIDKWLWAARFFKTRGLASEAVTGGKVHLGGQRVKPSREVKCGDELTIRRGHTEFVVLVRGICTKRGPAREAQKLYEETEQSKVKREQMSMQMRLLAQQNPASPRRPNKKQRRAIISFTRKSQ